MSRDKILLVDDDPRIIEMLVESFVRRFECNITCVAEAEDALDIDMLEPHSIAIVDSSPRGMDVFTFVRKLRELSDRPVILTGCNPTVPDMINAMRCGVTDFFPKPFQIDDLSESMSRAMAAHRHARLQKHKHDRARSLIRKVIRERRDLNSRIELICKDLVGAHKRLAMRVLDHNGDVGAAHS